MRMPTRHRDGAGSTGWEVIDRCTGPIRRGKWARRVGRERRVIRGDLLWARRESQRHLRDGGLERESDRGVRASRPGNSGGAKAPDFRRACEVGEDRGDWRSACKTPTTIREPTEQALRQGEGDAYWSSPWACREVCRKAGCEVREESWNELASAGLVRSKPSRRDGSESCGCRGNAGSEA